MTHSESQRKNTIKKTKFKTQFAYQLAMACVEEIKKIVLFALNLFFVFFSVLIFILNHAFYSIYLYSHSHMFVNFFQ